jgi:hypothetical protein
MLDILGIIVLVVLLHLLILPIVFVIVDTNLYILDDLGIIDREEWIKKR